MAELFVNDPQTTLAAAITSTGATTLSVVSSTGYPGTGNFRIRIDSELMLVTGVSGTTWTVTRGIESTTAATHLITSIVNHVFTAGGITQALSEASPPANVPSSGSFAWVNQASSTLASDSQGFSFLTPNSGGNNLTHRVYPVTVPYTFICGFSTSGYNGNFAQSGPSIRDTTNNKSIVWRWNNGGGWDIYTWIDPASYQYPIVSSATVTSWGQSPVVTIIQNDGVHRTYYTAASKAAALRGTWHGVYQEAYNAFCTEDKVGVFNLCANGSDQSIDVSLFSVT